MQGEVSISVPPETSDDLLESIFDQRFWEALAPDFTIEQLSESSAFGLSEDKATKHRQHLVAEGYIHVPKPGLKAPFPGIAALFSTIVDLGLPPVFAFVYDQLWDLHLQLHNLVEGMLEGSFVQLPEFWAWRVMPGQSGWKPHRDKPSNSLFSDRRPKSVTVWLPITQAHPLNGCMYVVPASRDSLYGQEGAEGYKCRIVDVRALPAEPGDVLLWTQHVAHWGAHAADAHDLPPRMSVAFEYQRRDVPPFRELILDPQKVPSFEERLALIAMQVDQYTHMYNFTGELLQISAEIQKRFSMPPGI